MHYRHACVLYTIYEGLRSKVVYPTNLELGPLILRIP